MAGLEGGGDNANVKNDAMVHAMLADITTHPLKDVGKVTDSFSKTINDAVDSVVKHSAVARIGVVAVEGLAYTVPGLLHGIEHDVTHLPETGVKLGSAAAIGMLFRLALPEAGAAKALAGTAMGGMFLYDGAKPFA